MKKTKIWVIRGVMIVLVSICALELGIQRVPLPLSLFVAPPPEIDYLDRHGKPLRAARADDGPFRRRVEYWEIPQPLVHATLAAEDRRFLEHSGVDWRATLRAAWQLVVNRRIISGASTITQQLIKLAQPRPRTFRTKLIEAAQASHLEQVWDKQRILAEYLNRVEYGNFNAGCSVAALYYFGKPLRDLSVAECALLAALPQSPARLNPAAHFARARKRQIWILGQMRDAGWLAKDEYERAVNEPLRLAARHRVFEAPHFVDATANAGAVENPARTTLDLELNRFAEVTIRRHLEELRDQGVGNAAAVVIDNRSGDVLALVGSENYFEPMAGQVNGALAPRSAGSTFKPFTYLLAFERGMTPASVVADVPCEFATGTGVFAPVNYNRHCSGPARCRLALANSLNIPAVKVLASIGGPDDLLSLLRECGLSTLNKSAAHYGLGLTIGNAEARLLELANAYACLARLGIFKPCRLLLDTPAGPGCRVADERAAYLIADILSDNAARTASFGSESQLRFDYPVACKTGTSSGFRDNWAFGYTPEFTVGVWVGNFDGSPMRHISGVTGAAPILHELIEHLHEREGMSWYEPPPGIVEAWINPISGKRVAEGSPGAVREKFISSSLPPMDDSRGPVRLGAEYREWAASADNWLGGRVVVDEGVQPLRINFPLPGTVIYLDPDLPDGGGRIRLEADRLQNIQWRSNSLKCYSQDDHEYALLSPGRHEISVEDLSTGVEQRTWIEVRTR